jgi:hypothetical protein
MVGRVVVVTTWDDTLTKILVRDVDQSLKNVVCLKTDIFTAKSATFAKGAAINWALTMSQPEGWILHVDGDILLPAPIDTSDLDKGALYGCRRYSVDRPLLSKIGRNRVSYKELRPCSQDDPFLDTNSRHRSMRRRRRLLPPGFFQLWHSSKFCDYPSQSPDASLDDMLHAERFERCEILPNYGVYHLESRDHDLKANWQGRTTGNF